MTIVGLFGSLRAVLACRILLMPPSLAFSLRIQNGQLSDFYQHGRLLEHDVGPVLHLCTFALPRLEALSYYTHLTEKELAQVGSCLRAVLTVTSPKLRSYCQGLDLTVLERADSLLNGCINLVTALRQHHYDDIRWNFFVIKALLSCCPKLLEKTADWLSIRDMALRMSTLPLLHSLAHSHRK